MGDAVRFDQVEEIVRPHAGGKHYLAAVEKISLQPRAGERQVVRDGQGEQQHRVAGDAAYLGSDPGIVGVVVMGPRNEFRHSGGAAGKLEYGRIGRIDPAWLVWRSLRGPRYQIPERKKIARGFAQHHLGKIEIAVPVRSDAGSRSGELRELAYLEISVRRQRRDRDAADFLQR